MKSKYVQHPFDNKFNFFMAAFYVLVKANISTDNLLNTLLKSAHQIRPDSVDVYIARSWLLYKDGKIDEALSEIGHAIKLDPQYAQPWVNCGIYYMAVNDNEKAAQAFRKAIEMYPGYPHKEKLYNMLEMATVNGLDMDT
jgi:tetratricopeptide (TPR) repeat protein